MKEKAFLKIFFGFSLVFLQLDLTPLFAMGKKEKSKGPAEQTQALEEEKTYETGSEYTSPTSTSLKESDLKTKSTGSALPANSSSSSSIANPSTMNHPSQTGTLSGTGQTSPKSSASGSSSLDESGQKTMGGY